jgi:Leucine-rich repeat (LRR) protein
LWFDFCRIPGLSGITASPNFQRLYLNQNTNSSCEFNTFNLDNFTKLDVVYAWFCDFTGFSHNFSNATTNSFNFDFRNDSELVNFSLIPPSGLTTFHLYGPNRKCKLNFANFPNGFTACTKTINEFWVNKNSLTAWTVNLPINVINVDFSSNRESVLPLRFGLSGFNINLTANTLMTRLNLNNNHITGITPTISACTSLQTLDLSYNDLLSLPTLPNSVKNLDLLANDLVGMSSLPSFLPSGLVGFNAGSVGAEGGGINIFQNWNIPLTGCPNLQSFSLGGVSLTGWTIQFPTSIKLIDFNNNSLNTFDFNYVTGTTGLRVLLNINKITGLTNFTGAIGVVSLDLSSNQITNQTNIIPVGGSFPSSLTALTLSNNQLTNWSTSFSGAPNLKTLVMQNCNLTQASVNSIICGLTGTSVTGGTLTLTNETNKPFFNSTPSGPIGTVGTGLWCKAQLTAAPKLWNVTNA